jgi:hypothetical protein
MACGELGVERAEDVVDGLAEGELGVERVGDGEVVRGELLVGEAEVGGLEDEARAAGVVF